MSINFQDPREKIIWEIALRQGKCTLKLRDNICTEYDCKNCTMRKYIDELKEGLPEYYKFRVDDEAESYVERELEHRRLEKKRVKHPYRSPDDKLGRTVIIIALLPFIIPAAGFLLLLLIGAITGKFR